MRKIYNNFIDKKDLNELKKLKPNINNYILSKPNGVVDKVLKTLKNDFNLFK